MTAVGEIVGYLRIDPSDWNRKIDEAKAKSDELGKKSPNIKIQVDSARALAQLEAVRAATIKVGLAEEKYTQAVDKHGASSAKARSAEAALISARNAATKAIIDVSKAEEKVTQSTDNATKSVARHRIGWIGLIAVLSPILIPVLAAAAGAAIGLGAALGVAGLAFIGIKAQMKAGTAVGQQYTGLLATLKTTLATLSTTAAAGMLHGLAVATTSVRDHTGDLNDIVGRLAPLLGDALGHAVNGLITLFIRLSPLMDYIANATLSGATAFEHWAANSAGPRNFVTWAIREMPVVAHALVDIAQAFGKIIVAAGPMGGVMLQALTAFSRLISAMPLGVLQVIVPLLISMGLAVKGIAIAEVVAASVGKLTGAFTLLTGSVKGFAYANALAGTSSLNLLGTLGKLAPIAAVVAAGVYGAIKVSEDKLGPAAGRGAQIADTVMKLIANRTHQTTDEIIAGVSGTDAQFQAYLGTLGNVDKTSRTYLESMHDKLGQVTKATTDFGYASGILAGAQIKAGIVIDGVTYTIDKQTTAAGLLKNALDRLNGTALSVEQTQNQFLDTLGQLTTAQKAGTASVEQNSAKGRVNREVLVSAITAANAAAQATADQTAKTHGLNAGLAAGVTSLKNHEDAIRRAAAAAGLDKEGVDKLIASLGRVPKNVVAAISIKDSASTQIATIKANLAALKSKQIDITTYIKNVVLPTVRTVSGSHDSRAPGGATGGLIEGPGTGTSDSVTMRVSRGEYIMPADSTSKYLPMLQAMRNQSATLPSNMGARAGGWMAGSGDSITVNNYISGTVTSENNLTNTIVEGIDARRRRKGMPGLVDSPGAPVRGITLP